MQLCQRSLRSAGELCHLVRNVVLSVFSVCRGFLKKFERFPV